MYSLTIERVFLLQVLLMPEDTKDTTYIMVATGMCSLATECVLLLQNVFSCYRMCSLATECVLLRKNATGTGIAPFRAFMRRLFGEGNPRNKDFKV